MINKMITNHYQVNKRLPNISFEASALFFWVLISIWHQHWSQNPSKINLAILHHPPPSKLCYFRLTFDLLGLDQSHSPHFGRFLRVSVFEDYFDWILHPFWGPERIQHATKLFRTMMIRKIHSRGRRLARDSIFALMSYQYEYISALHPSGSLLEPSRKVAPKGH